MAERPIQYQKLENKNGSGFQVSAPSLERLYIDSALALTDTLVKLDCIRDSERRAIVVEAADRETLMVSWLNEVLKLIEEEKFLCRRVVFQGFDGKKIRCAIQGDLYDPIRHGHVSSLKKASKTGLELGFKSDPDPQFFARVFMS